MTILDKMKMVDVMRSGFRFYFISKVGFPSWQAVRSIGMTFVGALLYVFSSTASLAKSQTDYILRIEMAPAVCHLDPSQSKRRKCLEGYSFVIKGLYPHSMGQHCATSSSAVLSPLQMRAIARVMPNDTARQQLWRSVGNCVDGNVSQYFRQIATYAERLKIPKPLMAEKSAYVKQHDIVSQLRQLNPRLSSDAMRFMCQTDPRSKHSVLTEIHICYGSNNSYKSCPSNIVSNCPSSFVIEGVY